MTSKKEKGNLFPKWSVDNKPIKVDKWDGTAVKNALDDAVRKGKETTWMWRHPTNGFILLSPNSPQLNAPHVLHETILVEFDNSVVIKLVFTEKFHYVENHSLMDGRLMICSLAVGLAMFALLWDYLHPFPQSRPILIMCVTLYFLLTGILTLYTTFKEKGIFLVAVKKDKAGVDPDQIWSVSSQMKRFDDIYHLVVSYSNSGKTNQAREAKIEKSVASWFDENGTLVFDLFEVEVSKLHSSLLTEKKEK